MATNTASASQRSTPRRDSTKYAAVTLTTAAARPIANMTRLFHSANATTTAIATSASTKLSRASQGRRPLAGASAPRVSADRSDMSVSCPANGPGRPPVSGEASRRGPRYTRPPIHVRPCDRARKRPGPSSDAAPSQRSSRRTAGRSAEAMARGAPTAGTGGASEHSWRSSAPSPQARPHPRPPWPGRGRRRDVQQEQAGDRAGQQQRVVPELHVRGPGDHVPEAGEARVRARAADVGSQAEPGAVAVLLEQGAERHVVDQRAADRLETAGFLERGPPDEHAAACRRGGPALRVIDLAERVELGEEVDEGGHDHPLPPGLRAQ